MMVSVAFNLPQYMCCLHEIVRHSRWLIKKNGVFGKTVLKNFRADVNPSMPGAAQLRNILRESLIVFVFRKAKCVGVDLLSQLSACSSNQCRIETAQKDRDPL